MLGIVTDSVACLPAELVERYGIRVVPVRIVRGERVYRDGVDVSVEDAFAWLAAGGLSRRGNRRSVSSWRSTRH